MIRQLLATQAVERVRGDAGGSKLRRALGWVELTAIGLGTMIGGIFTTIGVGSVVAGPGVLASFVLSGLACVFVAFCYAEFSSMVPVAGSAYTYAYATLGEFVAWVIGWDLLLEYGISVAPVAATWSGYMQSFCAGYGLTLPAWMRTAHLVTHGWAIDWHATTIDAPAALVTLAIAILLALGIKESALTNTLLVAVQLIAIVVFVFALTGFVRHASFTPFAPFGATGIVRGAALVFFAYIGFDAVTVASEEAKRPERDVPLGVIASLLLGMVLYLAATYVTVGIVPWRQISYTAGMLDAVHHAGNNAALALLVTIGAVAGATTVMITSLLGQVRIFYVMSRDRMLPPWVASVHPRFLTPARTTMATGIIVAVLAAIVPLDELLALVNIGTLSAFAIVCAGISVLRFTRPDLHRPFRAPLGVLMGILGCGSCLYLMIGGLSVTTWLRFVVWFVVGVACYAAYGYRHSLLRATSDSSPRVVTGATRVFPCEE